MAQQPVVAARRAMIASPAIADYDARAESLAAAWRTLDTRDVLAPVLHLLPQSPASTIDIGAGSGGDAAWFAAQGHRVLAVEPADGLRRIGEAQHASPLIEWLDDALPGLGSVRARNETFDLVMLTAVWAHLDHGQRASAVPNLAALLRSGGRLIMSIRHGWTPPTRPTFEARPDETISHAEAAGLSLIHRAETDAIQPLNRANGVRWTWLAFAKLSKRA